MGQQKVQAMMTSNSPPSSSSSLRYVDHTYRDFSRFVEEGGKLVKHKKSGNNFPARLHRVLSSTDPCHSAVISWMVSLVVCSSLFRFYCAKLTTNNILSPHCRSDPAPRSRVEGP
jgi:hypothetical protein